MKKTRLILSILFVVLFFISGTFAWYVINKQDIAVNVNFAGLDPYIQYSATTINGNDEITASNDYTGGISNNITFNKESTGANLEVYGHIYLNITNASSTDVFKASNLKWTLVSVTNSVETVISTGNFVGENVNNKIPANINFQLNNNNNTTYKIYIWVDSNSPMNNDISNSSINVSVYSEATTEATYNENYIRKIEYEDNTIKKLTFYSSLYELDSYGISTSANTEPTTWTSIDCSNNSCESNTEEGYVKELTGLNIALDYNATSYIWLKNSNNDVIKKSIEIPYKAYTITLNNGNATTAGTTQLYGYGDIYLDSNHTQAMSTSANNITVPDKTGFTFAGYYTGENGTGTQIIDENGYITSNVTSSTFNDNVTIYANWISNITSSIITITPGNGISLISMDGWTTDNNSIYKEFTSGETIDLTTLTVTDKTGYSGQSYAKTTGEGTLSDSTFTVGSGDATIEISATTLATPTCSSITKTGGYLVSSGGGASTQRYLAGYADVLLTANNTTSYDNGVSLYYSFGYASSTSATLANYTTPTTSNQYTIDKNLYVGNRYYGVQVYATDGTLTSTTCTTGTGTSRANGYFTRLGVTFNKNGASGSNYTRYPEYGGTTLYTTATGSNTATVPTYTKSGSSFIGFYSTLTSTAVKVLNADGSFAGNAISGLTDGSSWKFTAAKTIYAAFNKYTLPYNNNGGTGCTSKTIAHGSTYGTLCTPTQSGYIFDGWYTSSSGGTQVNSSTIYNSDRTIYAQWHEASSTYLQAGSSGGSTTNFLSTDVKKGEIKSIVFSDSLEGLTVKDKNTWDVSNDKSEEVLAWISDESTKNGTTYEITIGQEGGVIANPDSSYLFSYLFSLESISFKKNFDTSNVTDMSYMFLANGSLTSLDLSNFDTSNVTNMSHMFASDEVLSSLDLSNFDTSNVTSMNEMFHECFGLSTLNISKFDTSNVTDMSYMFASCWSLSSLNISSFDTRNVTNMSSMFNSCNVLTSLNLSNFNTSNVTNMANMFSNCYYLTYLNISSFNTSSVTDMTYMFYSCSGLTTLDISSFNTSNVTSMNAMFEDCSGLTTLDISNFNTSNVTSMYAMFEDCSGLTTLDISNFNTSSVTDMLYMFYGCSGLTSLDLSNFNTSSVTNMSYMFNGCTGLTTIYASDNFITTQVTSSASMFSGCTNLVGGNGTVYDSNYVDKTYAVIDTEDDSGYFTEKVSSHLMYGNIGDALENATGISGSQIYRIVFTDTISGHSVNDQNTFDASVENTEDILAWISDTTTISGETYYEITIGQEGGVLANEDCIGLFANLTNLLDVDLTYFDTSSVISMSQMFRNCVKLTFLNLQSFDTNNVVNMEAMFYDCSELETIVVSENFVTNNVQRSDAMFLNCTSIRGSDGTYYDEHYIDKTYAIIDGNGGPGYFTA